MILERSDCLHQIREAFKSYRPALSPRSIKNADLSPNSRARLDASLDGLTQGCMDVSPLGTPVTPAELRGLGAREESPRSVKSLNQSSGGANEASGLLGNSTNHTSYAAISL